MTNLVKSVRSYPHLPVIPYRYKFSRHVNFADDTISVFSRFYFRGSPYQGILRILRVFSLTQTNHAMQARFAAFNVMQLYSYRVIPDEINKEYRSTSWILLKFGQLIGHIKVITHTRFQLHMFWNFRLTAKNILNFFKKMDYLWLNN